MGRKKWKRLQWEKKGNILDGVILAYTKPKMGVMGTTITAKNQGVILRLIEEAEIQKKYNELMIEHHAKEKFKIVFPSEKEKNDKLSQSQFYHG